jgi:hypothetical protein
VTTIEKTILYASGSSDFSHSLPCGGSSKFAEANFG